jgi:hypothetical protein
MSCPLVSCFKRRLDFINHIFYNCIFSITTVVFSFFKNDLLEICIQVEI